MASVACCGGAGRADRHSRHVCVLNAAVLNAAVLNAAVLNAAVLNAAVR